MIVVIGAGLAGLTAAYELQRLGREVLVLEHAPVAGGVISSLNVDGFELDLGPNSVVLTPSLSRWIEVLGLQVLPAAGVSKNRFLVKNKTLYPLSPHPVKLMRSHYLSAGAKWGILTERFKRRGPVGEESVGAFFTRRFGREISEAVADPIFSGIYAGDISRLSIDQVMPMLPRWEKEYGSVTQGLLRNKSAMKGPRKIVNFSGGLGSLTDALAKPLAGRLRTQAFVHDIRQTDSGFEVSYGDQVVGCTSLVYAAPLNTIGVLPFFGSIGSLSVEYVPVRTVHVSVPTDALSLPEGFGFLVPSRERLALMGCIFSSSIFPSKAPVGSVLLTLILGGAHGPILEEKALAELSDILQIRQGVRVLHGHTWEMAIPQKNIGYAGVLASIRAFEAAHPGFRFVGNAVSGVSVGDVIDYAASVTTAL